MLHASRRFVSDCRSGAIGNCHRHLIEVPCFEAGIRIEAGFDSRPCFESNRDLSSKAPVSKPPIRRVSKKGSFRTRFWVDFRVKSARIWGSYLAVFRPDPHTAFWHFFIREIDFVCSFRPICPTLRAPKKACFSPLRGLPWPNLQARSPNGI